jgi:hypothetical protein
MAGEQGCDFRLDGLRQQRSRAVAQYLGQRIGKSSWLGQLENTDSEYQTRLYDLIRSPKLTVSLSALLRHSFGHGVSLLRWRSGGVEHPHDTPPYPFAPSPTFAHSSSSRSDMANIVGGHPLPKTTPI